MLAYLWLSFTLAFVGFAFYYFKESRNSIPAFRLPPVPGEGSVEVTIGGSSIFKPERDLVEDLNEFIARENRDRRRLCLFQTFTNAVAAVMALISLWQAAPK